MGSEPHQIIKALKSKPECLSWSYPREVQLIRGPSGKLGLRFQTVQCTSKGIRNTVVLRIRDTCIIKNGQLFNYDRIHKINGISLANKTEDEVDALFQDKLQTVFNLDVQSETTLNKADQLSNCSTLDSAQISTNSGCGYNSCATPDFSPTCACENTKECGDRKKMDQALKFKPKRMLSNTGSVGNTSLSSVERPSSGAPNKRFMKSSSTETDESGQQMDPVSPRVVHHPLAPSTNGYLQRMNSLPDPVPLDGIGIEIDDNERAHSLPQAVSRSVAKCHGCDNGVGAVKNFNSGHLNIRPCTNHKCGAKKDGCEWHILIFKVPQCVVWNTSTKKFVLNKGTSSTFGITKKVKIQEGTGEMYTLIESVAPGSVADMKGLHVGDWIRSINGQALQDRSEAHRTQFDHFQEIHLVIQRPEAILEKARPHISKIRSPRGMMSLVMPDRMNIPVSYSPSSPLVHPIFHSNNQAVSPVTPVQRPEDGVRLPPWRPTDRLMDQHLVSPSSPKTNDLQLVGPGLCRSGSSSNNLNCLCQREINRPGTKELVSQPSPEDNFSPMFGSVVSSPRSPRDNQVPCVKVFVCGNSAADLGDMILSRSQTGQRVTRDSNVQHFRFSLRRYENSNIVIDLWQRRKNGQHNQFHNVNRTGYFNSSTSSMCNQCGCDGDNLVVNVELFVIQNENFFHHCSHFMFLEDSIFLVAFNAQRILTNMSTDITKLEEMIHTIRSHLGCGAVIELYGVLSVEPGEEDKEDEVRTMFYANDKKHGKYSVSIQKINFVTRLNVCEAVTDLCSYVFNWTLSHCQKKSPAIECIADGLSGLEHEVRTVWTKEEVSKRIASVSSQAVEAVLHSDLFSILEQMGCLKGITDKSSPFQESRLVQEYFVHPLTVHNRLVALCFDAREVDSDFMLRLATTGVLNTSNLFTLLNNVVTDVELFAECLQALGIVFDIGLPDRRMGADSALLFPYFLEDLPCHQNLPNSEDTRLYAVFQEAVPWMLFYQLTSALSQREECVKIIFTRKRFCVATLKQVTLSLLFDKMNDQIIIIIDKGSNSSKENMILKLFQQLLALVVPPRRQYKLGIPCPLENNSMHIPGHVINLALDCPIKCGAICIDYNNKVRRWITVNRQMSAEEYLSQTVLKLPPGIFHEIVNRLIIPQENDWRALAGCFGKTMGDVTMYESIGHSTNTLPPKQLLIDWDRKEQGTIRQLIGHLLDLDRQDIVQIINDHIRTSEAVADS